MAMTISGIVIVLGTIYCLIKRYETRLVLFCAGLLMSIVGGNPSAALNAFSHAMLKTKLFEAIIAVMGFAMVMKYTECDKHLINLLIKPLHKARIFLIPATVLIVFFINVSITSSAGCSAAVGSILIPLLIASGVNPAIAGAAIYAGTYGAMFNPGYPQVSIIVNVAKSNPVAVVANHFYPLLMCGIIGAASLWIIAILRHEDKGYVPEKSLMQDAQDFHVNFIYAMVPLIPIVILILGNMHIIKIFNNISISHAMIIGVFCAFFVTRKNPQKISKEFWAGAGNSFGSVFGIIICALVFVSGLKTMGLIQQLIVIMTQKPAIAKMSAAVGPFILGVMSGSGDAAAVAFNSAVTIHAAQFGIAPMNMGSVVGISGALGRSMSPVAGGMIICATLAGVSPMETAKRNAIGMILAMIFLMVAMLFFS